MVTLSIPLLMNDKVFPYWDTAIGDLPVGTVVGAGVVAGGVVGGGVVAGGVVGAGVVAGGVVTAGVVAGGVVGAGVPVIQDVVGIYVTLGFIDEKR